ncbi:pilus assembly protein TadG-related protein [Streptomyces sp. M10(2022)]
MVVGLLFLAFAFFAVGQASATRNGAQGAADAAALAAAQDARDGMRLPFLAALESPETLDQFLREYRFTWGPCNDAAQRLQRPTDRMSSQVAATGSTATSATA